MAYNTVPIARNELNEPLPQYYNASADRYDVIQGRNGANRVELYGPDGNPISTTSGKLDIRASEIEALAGALTDAAVTDPAASATIIALLKGLLKQHQGGGSVKDQVDVIDRAARVLGKITADDAAIAALGALAAAAVIDPAASASVIALLKGLLKQLQGTGTGAAPVQLMGSIFKDAGNIATNVTVAAGATVTVYTLQDPQVYEAMFVAHTTVAHSFDLKAQYSISTYTCPAFVDILGSATSAQIAYTSTPYRVKSPHNLMIQINNKDTVEHVYDYIRAHYWYRRA